MELRDAHAKLRTTNEKLRRDKERSDKERDEFRTMVSKVYDNVFTHDVFSNCSNLGMIPTLSNGFRAM